MTREEALNVIWLRCQHNDKTYEAYCVLKHEQQPCDDATLKDIFCMGCEYKEQQPCDKCVYSTSEGCQYDDITEAIPPFETSDDAISREAVLDLINADWKYEGLEEPINSLPSVNPQKPIDLSVLNKWIGAEVLDRIRNEMHATAEKHEDGVYYLRDEWIDEIIDKYAEEGKA